MRRSFVRRATVLALLVLLPVPALAKGTARLLSVDAAEPIDRAVLGLQRTAVPLFGGIAVDTSLLADLALAPNLGLRWGQAFGDHRLVLGARYTQFVGTSIYSQLVNAQAPVVKRYEPTFSGPGLYALYGYQAGPVLMQLEGRMTYFSTPLTTVTAAVAWNLTDAFALVVEGGVRFAGGPFLRAAGGLRYTGEHFGFTLGAAYVGLSDPLVPGENLPVIPALDLSYTF